MVYDVIPARRILQILAILAAGLFIYAPVFSGGWLWDDEVELVENPVMTRPDGVLMAWKGKGVADYLPVKTTIQWVLTQITGKNSTVWHVLNFTLHLLNAFLIWHIFARLKLRQAWLGGLLFVAHPVLVMSVAWISEFKNTLSLAFLLPAMIFVMRFMDRPRASDYALALLFFVLAVLSKSSVVMFPVVILLYVWWRSGRITVRDLAWTIPFFAISLAIGLLTIHFQYHRAMGGYPSTLGWASRGAVAGMAVGFYFWKSLVPVGLLPTYPRWSVEHPESLQFLPWLLVAAGLLLLWWKRETWGRAGLFGVGFFLINLVPVLGFVPMVFSRFSFVSDHFLYLPFIGILGLLVAGAGKLWDVFPGRRALFGVLGGVVFLGMLVTSRSYAGLFGDEFSLWKYTLRNNPEAWQAHLRLGYFLIIRGDFDEAVPHQDEAIRLLTAHPEALALRSNLAVVYNNHASLLEAKKQPEDVEASLREAMRLDPREPHYPRMLGEFLLRQGKVSEANGVFAKYLKRHSRNVAMRLAYGDGLLREGRREEAFKQFEIVLALDPSNARARERLETRKSD
jgi:tetratricopeptide (TPR) repeat protein